MRLFVALDLPPDVVRSLESLLATLRPTARIAWSPPANLHITTKFIGWWPDERFEEVKTALAGVPRPGPLAVDIRGLGFFPNPHAPRVFWCGIDAPGLERLAADTDRATAALGVESEKRAFSPHLTLARIKERLDLRPLHQAVAGLASVEFGRYEARSFFLYRSQPGRKGSVYTQLAEFPL
jgi:RNA 2',3'-cyclic 3'-phosphodiesterase